MNTAKSQELKTNSFKDIFDTYDWDEVLKSINNKTQADVVKAISSDKRDLEDFKALLSPAAKVQDVV